MRLSQNSGVPIYQQIADSFKSDILAGKYAQGEYLPSIRGLARDLKVEASLTEAIAAARIAGLSDDELKNMLDALLMVQD